MQNRTWFSRQTAYARFYRHARPLPRLGRPASSTTTAWQMAATSFVQKTKTNWTFRNLQCSFMPTSQPPEWHGIQPYPAPYSNALIHVSCHFYVASNELCSPGERPEFRFLNGLVRIRNSWKGYSTGTQNWYWICKTLCTRDIAKYLSTDGVCWTSERWMLPAAVRSGVD